MHPEFCYLEKIPYDIRYATSNNFVGRPIAGYAVNKCIVSKAVASALISAQQAANKIGLSLIIFEAYRPLKAVEDILSWSTTLDEQQKSRFYPEVEKERLFELGYLAVRSGHTRGAAVDVTLINAANEELDMGTEFDYFGEASHTASEKISEDAKKNRQLLLSIMEPVGFINYDKEWWHFALKDEPFPESYFDFDVI